MTPGERRTRAAKRAFLNAFKTVVGCKDCGTSDGRLDFDHRDKSTKLFKIGANVSQSWVRIRAEMEKCDVRCASCHTRRHRPRTARHRPKRGRGITFRSHCKRGHSLSGTNVVVALDGTRRCRKCRQDWERKRYWERKAS